jgi:hypothetical protein
LTESAQLPLYQVDLNLREPQLASQARFSSRSAINGRANFLGISSGPSVVEDLWGVDFQDW